MMKLLKKSRTYLKILLPTLICVAMAIMYDEARADRIYKWVDRDGNTVYSQTPPPAGIQAERIRGAPPPPEDPEAAMKKLRERAEAFNERRDERINKEQREQEEADTKQKQSGICAKLKKDLQTLQTNTRIREVKEGKEPVVLGEEQRQAKIKSIQERIQKECTSK